MRVAPAARHARDGYDVCDTTHCQVFGAGHALEPRGRDAHTRGVVLAHGGAVVRGAVLGIVQRRALVAARLCGVAMPQTSRAPGRTRPTTPSPDGKALSRADALVRALREAGYRGDVLRDVRDRRARQGGRAVADRARRPGARRDSTPPRSGTSSAAGSAGTCSRATRGTYVAYGVGYRFTGRGKGHGAGLCLRGASTLAARGGTADAGAGHVRAGCGDRLDTAMPSRCACRHDDGRGAAAASRSARHAGGAAGSAGRYGATRCRYRCTPDRAGVPAGHRPGLVDGCQHAAMPAASAGNRGAPGETTRTAGLDDAGVTALRFRIDVAPAAPASSGHRRADPAA